MNNKRSIVLVTGHIHEDGLIILRKEGVEVRVHDQSRPYSKEELIHELQDVDGVIALTEDFDEDVIKSSKRLKVISRHGVGYDNINVDAASRAGVFVTVTSFALSESVAETAFGLMLLVARKFTNADRFVKEKMWTERYAGPSKFMGVELARKSLGIVGLGRIGAHVAKRALAFDMKVMYHDVMRNQLLEQLMGIEYLTLDELLAKSDFITIHAPLTQATRGLIGEKELKKMKRSSFLINTSRGPLVDQKALVSALKEKWIAGAGLDVFELEPIAPSDPILELDNVILTPHISSATNEARSRMSREAALNVLTVLRGEQPQNVVNPNTSSRMR